jgi:hypothetical protein
LTALILLTTLVCATKINVYPEKSAKKSYQSTTPAAGFPYSTSNYYQGKIYVSSTGWKSWDLTAYVAGKYANNQTRTTVTLRGASETLTDCDLYRNWDRNDLILKGSSTSSKPYLVIDYTAC